MDNRSEIREFLISRRARISPQQAGLPSQGPRRVPGLRRSEVARLARVSLEYYTRLERGNLAGVSDSVLDALARALRLDDAVRAHPTGTKRVHHPVAGRLELTFEVLIPAADDGQVLVVYGSEPGSASADGLRLLASWTATRDGDSA